MQPVRIGFIGAGDVADLHAEGIRACPGAELSGFWTRSSGRAVVLYTATDYDIEFEMNLRGVRQERIIS